MARSPVLTRAASLPDLPVLVGLWTELRQVGGRAERAVNPVAVTDVTDGLRRAVSSPDCRVVLACIDHEPVGMAIFTAVTPDPLSDCRLVHLAHLVVAPGHRRRGVGRALVAAAADFGDDQHIEYLSVGVYPSMREASRFLARLGFAAVQVHRVAPVAVLRRRLGGDAGGRLDHVARRRSRLRRPIPGQRAAAPVRQPAD